jgi:hypothetical protein
MTPRWPDRVARISEGGARTNKYQSLAKNNVRVIRHFVVLETGLLQFQLDSA